MTVVRKSWGKDNVPEHILERRAYARGYAAAAKSAWPAHRPPMPPADLVRGLYEAALALADVADSFAASVEEGDELAARFLPHSEAVYQELEKVSAWLLDEGQEPKGKD